jgi:N-acetylglutamate synthase-like GNAT family acetyltransferase
MIREAEAKDIEAISEIATLEEKASPPTDVLQSLVKHYPALVNEERGRVVGFWITEALGDDILLVRDFAVWRAERYHRYGRKLMSQLLRRARDEGYRTLLISLQNPEPASDDFLRRSGWNVAYETGATRIFSRSLL